MTDVGQQETDPKDPTAVSKIALRLTQGAAVLTAMFTFFGIKDGQLDRLLRNEHGAAIALLALVAVGILLGLFIQVFERISRPYAIVVTIVVAALVSALLVFVGSAYEGRIILAVAIVTAVVVLLGILNTKLPGAAVVLFAACIVFLVGVGGLAKLSVDSKRAKDRPRIDAKLEHTENGWIVTGGVKAQGLTSQESIRISVEGVSFATPLAGRGAGQITDQATRAETRTSRDAENPGNDFFQTVNLIRIGPDSEGKIDEVFSAPLTTGVYERVRVAAILETEEERSLRQQLDAKYDRLFAEERSNPPTGRRDVVGAIRSEIDRFHDANPQLLDDSRCSTSYFERSCIVILMPQGTTKPLLSISPAPDSKSLTVHVVADDLNPDDRIAMQIYYNDEVALTTGYSAGQNGAIDQAATLPIDPTTRRVCVQARIESYAQQINEEPTATSNNGMNGGSPDATLPGASADEPGPCLTGEMGDYAVADLTISALPFFTTTTTSTTTVPGTSVAPVAPDSVTPARG